jgi:UDP-N-acetylmuramate--alanine ligase
MFLGLRPDLAVVTNIEWDHPDFFTTSELFFDAFARFAALLPEDGLLIACADDAGARQLAGAFAEHAEIMTYGVSQQEASWSADGLVIGPAGSTFDLRYYGQGQGRATLTVPGRVNVLNALAAVAACTRIGVSPTDCLIALESFSGVGRRFDVLGEAGGVVVVDDYAHNPSKIRAALQAARGRFPEHDIWAVWQPHTYSRTHTFLDKYATAFAAADHVLVTEIYAAREQPVSGVTGAATAAAIRHEDARFVPDFEAAVAALLREVKSPGVIVVMSAGDANWIGREFLARRADR